MIVIVDNEKLRVEFAARLNEACDDAGLPPIPDGRPSVIAAEITRRVKNVSRAAARKWLSGESIPRDANIKALADWLGVRREWLQYGRMPKHGSVVLPIKAGPLTNRLAVQMAQLEERGLLNQKLFKSIKKLLDVPI